MVLVEILETIEQISCVIEVFSESEVDWACSSSALLFVMSDFMLFDFCIKDVYHNTKDNENHSDQQEQVFGSLNGWLWVPFFQEQDLPALTFTWVLSAIRWSLTIHGFSLLIQNFNYFLIFYVNLPIRLIEGEIKRLKSYLSVVSMSFSFSKQKKEKNLSGQSI